MGLNQQPVSPNAEDLSLILGTIARGRSFSTTMTPKTGESAASGSSVQIPIQSPTSNAISSSDPQSQSSGTGPTARDNQRRKKSVPHTQKERNTASAEDFFIDVILQRHARRLLQERRLIDLGMMSAALDFHLVGWLTREKDRAARVEDFVIALKQLHEDLDWPKPNLDLKLDLKPASNDSHQDSPSYSLQSLKLETHIETVDSGYTSLPLIDTTRTMNYDPKLSQLALKNMNLPAKDTEKLEAEANLQPHLTESSVCSEQMSSYWADEEEAGYARHPETISLDSCEINASLETPEKSKRKKTVPHKLEVSKSYIFCIWSAQEEKCPLKYEKVQIYKRTQQVLQELSE